jgi:choline kinase
VRVRDAIILAAGLGTRIRDIMGVTAKQFIRINSIPLFLYPILCLWRNGVDFFIVVVNPIIMDDIDRYLERISGRLGFNYEIILNPYPGSGNGNSFIIGAKEYLRIRGNNRVFLSVSDHIFSPNMPGKLIGCDRGDIVVLGDDLPVFIDIGEATRIYAVNDKIISIGKGLEKYNYIDTGLFMVNNPSRITGLFREDEPISLSSIIGDKRVDSRVVSCMRDCLWKDIDHFIDLEILLDTDMRRIIKDYEELLLNPMRSINP